MLQDGIYYNGGMPGAFRLLQMNFVDGTPPASARDALAGMWEMLRALTRGEVRDLRKELRDGDPVVVVPSGDLQVLLGYGARFFDASFHTPPMTDSRNQPRRLQYLRSGNANTPFRSLKCRNGTDSRLAPADPLTTQSDIALQFTTNSELSANRAIVEVSKLIHDDGLPLRITNFFSGFKREDRRSWIDFHDGINNMSHEERRIAIEITGVDRDWIVGGTYMTFLQIHVNLERWRPLPRRLQELVVGRDKLTGCPVTGSTQTGVPGELTPVFMRGCPVGHDLTPPLPDAFVDPPQPIDPNAQSSHIHRTNLNRGSPSQGSNNRIYRQGYEFLQPDPAGGVLHGLHFVAFHRSIKFVTDILKQDFWMGDVNFGGVPGDDVDRPPPVDLMQLLHGAYYGVPPAGADFPGSDLFAF